MPYFEVSRYRIRYSVSAQGTRHFEGCPSWVVIADSKEQVQLAFRDDDLGGFLITPLSVIPLTEAIADWSTKKYRENDRAEDR